MMMVMMMRKIYNDIWCTFIWTGGEADFEDEEIGDDLLPEWKSDQKVQPSLIISSLQHNKHKSKNNCLEMFKDKIVNKYMADGDMKSAETKFSPG